MIAVRRAEERGHFDQGWFAAFHTFSFDHYRDPEHTGFRTLRALNEERVSLGIGHPHAADEDAEVLSYVLEGALEQRDASGASTLVKTGELHRVSARAGETLDVHPANEEPVRLLQFWLRPDQADVAATAEQRHFTHEEKRGRLRLLASPDGAEGSLRLGQDTRIYASVLSDGDRVIHELPRGRHAWVQVVRGSIAVNGRMLTEGDGAAVSQESRVALEARSESELVLFDLA